MTRSSTATLLHGADYLGSSDMKNSRDEMVICNKLTPTLSMAPITGIYWVLVINPKIKLHSLIILLMTILNIYKNIGRQKKILLEFGGLSFLFKLTFSLENSLNIVNTYHSCAFLY